MLFLLLTFVLLVLIGLLFGPKGDLFNLPELITDWTFRAVADDDSTAEFRSLEIDLGFFRFYSLGESKEGRKNQRWFILTVLLNLIMNGGDFGLTLDLSRSRKSGVRLIINWLKRDENNSVLRGKFGGGGSDSVVTYGVYDSYQTSFVGIPWFSSLPILGYFFRA